MKKFFWLNDEMDADRIFGSETPTCLDEEEIGRLGEEWQANDGDDSIWTLFHEASADEIMEHGTYDSDTGETVLPNAAEREYASVYEYCQHVLGYC